MIKTTPVGAVVGGGAPRWRRTLPPLSSCAGALALIASACSDSTSFSTVTTAVEDGPVPAFIEVGPADPVLAVGETLQFEADVTDASGNSLAGSQNIVWETTDSTVMTVDGGGMVEGLSVGSASVFARAHGLTGVGSASVRESDIPPPAVVTDLRVVAATDRGLTVEWTEIGDGNDNPANYALRYGSPTLNWSAGYPTEEVVPGVSVGGQRQLTFADLDPETVYEFRIVAFRGTLNVDAVFGAVSGSTSGQTLAGPPPEIARVVASPDTAFLSVGQITNLSAVALDAVGQEIDGVTFGFQSLDASVVEVDDMGRSVARAAGLSAIVVSAICCGPEDTVTVIVDGEEVTVASLTVFLDGNEFTASQLTMTVDDTTTFTIVALDQSGDTIAGITPTWSSSNTDVMTVSDGEVVSVALGEAVLTAEYQDISASLPVVVQKFNEPLGMTEVASADGSVVEDEHGAMGIPWLNDWHHDGGQLSQHIEVVDDSQTRSRKSLRCTWRSGNSPECAQVSGNFPGGPYSEVYARMEMSYESNWDIGQKLFYIRTSEDSSTDFYVTREPDGSMIVFGQGGESLIWLSGNPDYGGREGFRPMRHHNTLYVVEIHAVNGTSGNPDEFHMWINGERVASKVGSIGSASDRWANDFHGIEFYFDTEQAFSVAHHRLGEVYISVK